MCWTDKQFSEDTTLLHNILKNTRRYVSLFCEAIDALLPDPDVDMVDHTGDVLDLIMQQRREMNVQVENGDRQGEGNNTFPPELMRR